MTHPTRSLAARLCSRLAAACLALACTAGLAADAEPAAFNTRFAAIAFHDIVDSRGELDDDAVTTERLVAFFDWLRGNGWTAISLDDVERARRAEKPLPERAVLISFDDGYRSLYTRAYPLLQAYRMPAVAALVGDWLAAPSGATVRYGQVEVPRERFISWEQAREMQRSGLVEFALHTQSMHQEVLGNPQGNRLPAATTRRYDSGAGYESEAAFSARVRDDLARGQALLRRELGRAPRALAWPYGRYNAIGVREARSLGFSHLLTLDVAPADARRPLAIARYLPTFNPSLGELVLNLQPDPNELHPDRLTCLDPAVLWTGDAARDDERLGRLIERLRVLGLTAVVVDAVQRDAEGHVRAAWFPNRELPVAGDVLSRIAWQLQSRAGVEVHVRLPHRAALAALGRDAERVRRLYEDLGAMVPLSGWVLEGTAPPASLAFDDPAPLFGDATRVQRGWAHWVTRERRRAHLARLQAEGQPDALAWQLVAVLDAARPDMKLLWQSLPQLSGAAGPAPHPLAEASLVPTPLDWRGTGPADPRLTRWFTADVAPDAEALARAAQAFVRQGGVSLGWCPDEPFADRPQAADVAPAVSASTFPARR
ncbi:MAG TPA: poly-beta-1,6-N-acetyl-D-glucosamine N-deacetylase PgaB [Rhizobacter sp.]|nr:poly-beta-1,6-N-acetyl-D-glucosamine N-deacetylase PgaB [Rhizobacter sp.]